MDTGIAAAPPAAILRRELAVFAGLATVFVLALWAAGRLDPWITPDTAGYFDLGGWPAVLEKPRHPLYGWLAGAVSSDHALLPFIQVVFYCAAAGLLYRALRLFGASATACAALGAVLIVSNVVLLWGRAVHPEVPATAMAILAVAALLRIATCGLSAIRLAGLSLALSLACFLRPTLLPGLVVFPILLMALMRLKGRGGVARAAGWAFIGGSAPVAAFALLRLVVVGDANVVSFGGFQMSGMAGLMLDEAVVAALPHVEQPLARRILDDRTAAERAGRVIATPLNSSGERSFVSAALGYFDLYARTYDDVLHGVIAPLRGEWPWVAWNRRLQSFSIAVFKVVPGRYAAWVVGASSRAAGRLTVTNLPFALGLAGCLLLLAVSLVTARPFRPAVDGQTVFDVMVLTVIVTAYTLSAGALMVLVTFPAGRYLDAAGALLPAIPVYAMLRGLSRLSSSRIPSSVAATGKK